MKSATKSWAVGLLILALLLFFAPALQPLLRADFTCGYDNVFHLWRAVQIDHLWSQGVLFSRWAPDMAHGFGFPLFLFMPPGTAVGAALLHWLGLAWPVALNALLALGMIAGGLFMFALARDLFGSYAGMVAAVGYVYAPFLAYDVFNRGSLSESVTWAFPPLILWALHRWTLRRERGFLVAGTFGLAALMLSHHPFGFLFAPLFGLWVLLEGYLARDWRVVWRGVLLGGLGLGLAAFFWLPPLLERGWVQTDRLLGTWVFDYHYNFLSLDHVLALPRAADPYLMNDWPPKALGLVPVLVALLPGLHWKRLSHAGRWYVLLLWLVTPVFTFLVLSPSVGLWERLSLLSYIQFPWRYLGPAAFCLALLAGAGVSLAADDEPRRFAPIAGFLASLVVTAGLIAANLGWFFPTFCAAPADTSPAALIAWERATDTLGTTAKGEYLPIWVEQMPDDGALDAAYAAGEPVARLPEHALPPGATILSADYGALRATLELETPAAFQARYLAFYYPGWKATVDGAPVDVTPEPQTGLVTFPVPAGRHRIAVWFGETPLRLVADGISVLSLVLLVALLLKPANDELRVKRCELPVTSYQASVTYPLAVGFVAAGLAVVAVKLWVVDQNISLWRGTRLQADGTLAGIETPANINFGGRALLLGYDLPEQFAADAAPVVTLYWRALNPEGYDWRVGLVFIGADGTRWSPVELRDARWARNPPPLAEWPPEQYARMDNHVDVRPGMPPGDYTLALSLFDRGTLEPASVLGADGNPVAPEAVLGQVRVLPPRQTPALAALEVAEGAALQRCGALGLWTMTADRAQAAPGDVVALRWVWETLSAPSVSLLATVTLRDAAGDVARTWYLPPAATWWPTDQWQANQRWIGRPIVRLPGSLDSGEYTLRVGLPGCDELASVPLRVVAPERRWTVPDGFVPHDVVLGEVIRLAGVTVETGDAVTVRLAWQALAEMETSYRVFVHIVGAAGQTLAQSDGEPAGWTRPTTGWAVGEVVLDERVIAIPGNAAPGDYTIRVGLYAPDGPRLTTPAGDDAIVIGMFTIH
ncbi:MAG TPA: hypothetical protein PKZ84_10415 [Anaerolineae bacterium]|nr:hypothetical protein [Anaerolineae bacterium]HQI85049.1 hypothetical protein [Anaerolineae bacterium]